MSSEKRFRTLLAAADDLAYVVGGCGGDWSIVWPVYEQYHAVRDSLMAGEERFRPVAQHPTATNAPSVAPAATQAPLRGDQR